MIAQQDLVDHHLQQHDRIKGQLAKAGVALINRLAVESIELSLDNFGVAVLVKLMTEFPPSRRILRDGKWAIVFLIVSRSATIRGTSVWRCGLLSTHILCEIAIQAEVISCAS
tara:strand:- start:238 stop:576 length:339 start_codon:yes stop_codon:yes gene_type:complete